MASNELQSGLTEQPLTMEEQGFDYTILDVETQIVIQQRTSEIKGLMRRTAQDTIDIGQKLIEVKERLGHGSFMNWLKSEFDWSLSSATRFMQVSEQFKFVNLANLNIAASALYLLAAPSTPPKARKEVLNRATQGEVITYALTKAIIHQHKKAAKPKVAKKFTTDVPFKTVRCESSTPNELESTIYQLREDIQEFKEDKQFRFQKVAVPFVQQTVETERSPVVELSEDKFPEKKIEALKQFQMNNRFHYITPAGNRCDYSPQDQAKVEMQLLFGIGKLICITDFEQQDYTWLGKVAEVKEATATDIEVVIRISLQPSTV